MLLEEVVSEVVASEVEEQMEKVKDNLHPLEYLPRYLPDTLPWSSLAPLHDLPENYMKNLPKFMGEGDLTTTKHIAFFDQFTDILGIEHKDVYSRLLVQNFEGQLRTWFQGLPIGSIR